MNIQGMLTKFGKSITIQKKTITATNDYTGDTVSWSTHLSTAAVFARLSGAEQNKCDKLGIQASLKMYLQSCDITVKHRVLYNSVYYNVVLVENPQYSSNFYQVYLSLSENYEAGSNE